VADYRSTKDLLEAFLSPPPTIVRASGREHSLVEQAEKGRLQIVPGTENDIEEISYYRWGNRSRQILCFHGWGGKAVQFFAFIPPLLESGFSVIAFDAPAHGRSSGCYASGPAFARAAREVARAMGPVTGILAYSLGAAAAVIAMDSGLTVSKAVLLAPMGFIAPLLETFIMKQQLTDAQADLLRQAFQARYPQRVLSVPEIVPGASTRALIFHDPNDQDIPIEDARQITQAWSGSEFVALSGVGHWRILRTKKVIGRAIAFFAG
jgi:pimeloyl-ACP methyl ester carboxylesterase